MMSLRSVLLCSVLIFTLAFAEIAEEPSKKFIQTPDGPAPLPTVRNVKSSVTPSSTPIVIDSTTNSTDAAVSDIEYFKQKYNEFRSRFDDWLKDPEHPENRQIILPAILGAIVGVSLLFVCLFTRCICRVTKFAFLAIIFVAVLIFGMFYLKNKK